MFSSRLWSWGDRSSDLPLTVRVARSRLGWVCGVCWARETATRRTGDVLWAPEVFVLSLLLGLRFCSQGLWVPFTDCLLVPLPCFDMVIKTKLCRPG